MIDLQSGLDIDKLNFVRRRMSLEMNIDFTNSETIEKLIAREFSLIPDKSKYKDLNSKLEKIRRKFSYELDKDIKSTEIMPLILEKAYIASQRIKSQKTKVKYDLVYEELSKGTTIEKCSQMFGISKMTIHRIKNLQKEYSY